VPPTSAVVNLPHSVVAGKQWNKFLGEVSAPAKVIPANNEIGQAATLMATRAGPQTSNHLVPDCGSLTSRIAGWSFPR